MKRADYQKERDQYLGKRSEAVGSLEKASVTIEVDGKNGKENVTYGYDYTKDDKQGMLSITESVDNFANQFIKDGVVDHEAFNEAAFWSNKQRREGAFAEMLKAARAEGIDYVMKQERNIDFNTEGRQSTRANTGYGEVGQLPPSNTMKVKYSF